MEYKKIKNVSIPALGLGTYGLRGRTATAIVAKAIDIGYRHIDTAQFYDNEVEVGRGIRQANLAREEIFLTTKVWWEYLSPDRFALSVADSLRKLKLDYVDLLLIHWPNPDLSLKGYIQELLKVQERGWARHIGVANFPVALVKKALKEAPGILTNQVEYHPFLDQSVLLSYLQKQGLSLTAYTPIAKGKVIGNPVIRRIAHTYDKNEVQVTLRWLLNQHNVMAIPKTANPDRLAANMDIFDFTLTDKEMKEMSALYLPSRRMVDPAFGPDWD